MRFQLAILNAAFFGTLALASAQPVAPPAREVPAPPVLHPRTAVFRQLLAADAEQRQALLASKRPQTRETLLAKVEEYRAMPSTVRDRQLQLLDLRGYIEDLRNVPASQRAALIRTIPEADRKLVQERLAIWDALSAEQQRQVWLYDVTKTYLMVPALPPSPPGMPVATAGPASSQPSRLEEAAQRWRALPPEKQAEIAQNSQRVFEEEPPLPPGLSPRELTQAKQTLRTLMQLAPGQREKCVEGFHRFAALPAPERQRVIKNINLWNELTADQRIALRALTEHLPPLPPGFYDPPPPPSPDFNGALTN